MSCTHHLMPLFIAFAPIRHAQKELEASSSPTLMNILSMLEDIKQKMNLFSLGIASQNDNRVPYERTKLLASATL